MVVTGCDVVSTFPKDPEGTLDNLKGGTLHAGVIHAPPWIDLDGQDPAGIEAELVRNLAHEHGARVRWQRGAPDQLLRLLKDHELDIVVGGFEHNSHALRSVGQRPYGAAVWCVVPGGELPFASVKGERVLVKDGKGAALIREKGGIPVFEGDAASGQVVALPGLKEVLPGCLSFQLGTSKHALAVPPGENAWAVAIDRSLHRLQKRHAVRKHTDN